jgi:S1-C subfamily serine protease
MYLTTWLLIAAIIPGDSKEVPEAVRNSGIPATVRISDPANGSVGSGAVVGVREGFVYILTSSHLFGRDAKPTVETFAAKRPVKADSTHPECELVCRTADSDLAIVRLPADKREWKKVQLAPTLSEDSRLDTGWAVGCDDGREPRTTVVTLTGKKLVRRAGKSSAFFWQAKGEAVPGRSGGPLLDQYGRLIGVCSGTQESRSYYTHLEEIRTFLRDNDMHWVLAEKPAGKK